MQGVHHRPHAQKKRCTTLLAQLGLKMAPVRPSEEELGRKWDRCLVDTTFKTGILTVHTRGKILLISWH